MTDFAVRPVEDSELRAASTLFRRTLHLAPVSDEQWEYWSTAYESGRVLAAFADQQMIGTAMSWRSSLALPGGGELPMAAVSGVGVRADHTRRGVLTELIRTQLLAAADAGEVLAGLHASEPLIYGRFGYGIATLAGNVRIRRREAALRPDVPRSGEVRLADADQALSLMPAVYERGFGQRPGMMRRSASWWRMAYEARLRTGEPTQVALHIGADGPDGYVSYAPRELESRGSTHPGILLRVVDLQATNPEARNDLWHYLLGVDLVDEILTMWRPTDEPIEAMLVDRRAVRTELDDDLWVRLVDVPAALAARRYGAADPVVIEVRDQRLPANSGRYLISPHGTERTAAPAGLAMDVDVLAMIYLGATAPSALAGIGRIEATDPAALARADRLFATDVAPWCGTMF